MLFIPTRYDVAEQVKDFILGQGIEQTLRHDRDGGSSSLVDVRLGNRRRAGLNQRILDDFYRVIVLGNDDSGDRISTDQLEDLSLVLLFNLHRRLDDVIKNVFRRPLRIELGQIRTNFVPLARELVARDAAANREELLATDKVPTAGEFGFQVLRQVADFPLGCGSVDRQ